MTVSTSLPVGLPRQRHTVIVTALGAGALLRGPQGEYRVNETGLALWEVCDGRTSLDEMVDAMVELFDATPEKIRRDVTNALRAFEYYGLVDWVESDQRGEGTGP